MRLYLNQTCEVAKLLRDASGKAILDAYGSPTFNASAKVPCRKELSTAVVQTSNGDIVQAQYIYYVAEQVDFGDKIDDRSVVSVSQYTTLAGVVIGYECRT